MEAFFPLMLIFGFIIAITLISSRSKERRERLRILEDQLRAGNLDGAGRQRVVDELTGRQTPAGPPPQANATPRPFSGSARFAFGIGWMTIFLGIALLMTGGRDEEEAGIILIPLGFALVTLPIALRELESDRRQRRA